MTRASGKAIFRNTLSLEMQLRVYHLDPNLLKAHEAVAAYSDVTGLRPSKVQLMGRPYRELNGAKRHLPFETARSGN